MDFPTDFVSGLVGAPNISPGRLALKKLAHPRCRGIHRRVTFTSSSITHPGVQKQESPRGLELPTTNPILP